LEAIHDTLRHVGGVIHRVGLLGKAVHGSRIGGGVIRTENLFAYGLEGVAGIWVDVVGLVVEEEALGVGVSDGQSIPLGAVDAVDFRVDLLHPAEHVVEGPVLHDEHDDSFDWACMGCAVEE
jgi:hypothetical protein